MKIPYTNDSSRFVHIGPVTIPPYETREVDPAHLPGAQQEKAPVQEQQDDPLVLLAAQSIAKIKDAIGKLSDTDLAKLDEIEQGKGADARKGALEAIAEERLARAQGKFEQDALDLLARDEAELIASLKDLQTELLDRAASVEAAKGAQARMGLIEAIDAELEARRG